MSICPADGWVAVYTALDDSALVIPLVVWQEACIDGVTAIVGYVLQDRSGLALPYPVAAPSVFGFLYYAKVNASREDPIEVFGLQ